MLSIVMGGNFDIMKSILWLEPVSCKAWWFITEYVTIMLLSPLINEGIKAMTITKIKYALLGFFYK